MNSEKFVLTQSGYPLKVFHGTRETFERFRSLSHFGSRKGALEILKIPYVKSEYIDLFSQNTKKEPISSQESHIIPAYLLMQNPLKIPDTLHSVFGFAQIFLSMHLARQYQVNDIFYFAKINARATGLSFENFLTQAYQNAPFIPTYRFIFDTPQTMPIEAVKKELRLEKLYSPNEIQGDEEKNRVHLIFQRLIRYLEQLGYDGFSYRNMYEDKGHTSYIIFRPEQVIRLDTLYPHKPQKNNPSPTEETALQYIYETTLQKMPPRPLSEMEIKNQIAYGENNMVANEEDEKRVWTLFALKEVMPKIAEITQQPVYGYHGLTHTEQVVLYGIEYALAEKTNPLPVILACALHDCARTDNTYNTVHGPLCEPIARAFLEKNHFHITPQEKEQIIFAIIHHTTGRNAPDLISACLWDADRTRLSWERGYHESFFNTARAKEVANFSRQERKHYIKEQTAFLDSLNTPALLNTQGRKEAKKNTLPEFYKKTLASIAQK